MAKILGIREQIGAVRDIQGAGFYEQAGTVERQYSPYMQAANPPVVGYKYGPRQWWPVWERPPLNLADLDTAQRLGVSPVVGGPCPVDLHVGPYGSGYSCVKGVGSFGAVDPYDLGAPGRVAEIKKVLIALARHQSDSLQTPPPLTQKEDIYKHINTKPEFLDAWDGPTADAFAIAVSRYKHMLNPTMPQARQSPVAQLPKFKDKHGNDVIIGGPQPTVAGLETLAQAAHRVLRDTAQLGSYLQWRGGSLDCEFLGPECEPPDTFVTPTKIKGPDWNPRGWTVAWRTGPNATKYPNLLPMLDAIDVQLEAQWAQAPNDANEDQRKQRADVITDYRQQRNDIVKQLNEGAAEPNCADPSQVYDSSKGACVARCKHGTVWDPQQGVCVLQLPTVTDHHYRTYDECVTDQLQYVDEKTARKDCGDLTYPESSPKYAMLAVGGLVLALGVGGYFLFRDKGVPAMPAPE